METQVTATPLAFPSHDATSTIQGMVWEPCAGTTLRGIVQIVHGMNEHCGRYDQFARFLAERGFVVCAHDHIGHGKTTPQPEKRGCMPAQGGKDILIADVHRLRTTVATRYDQHLPYVLFGHSMGSFIVRAYLARHADGVAAVVLCGTAQQPRAVSAAGKAAAHLISFVKGEDFRSPFLHRLGAGAFSRQIEQPRTSLDWLSYDPQVVDSFINDELCSDMFSAGGYATLTDLTGEIATPACAKRVPSQVPILLIAGEDDPVGKQGKGVNQVANQLRRAGLNDVQVKLYPNMRHEILNEPERKQVFQDVVTWIEEHI